MVGIACTAKRAALRGFSSTFSFAIFQLARAFAGHRNSAPHRRAFALQAGIGIPGSQRSTASQKARLM